MLLSSLQANSYLGDWAKWIRDGSDEAAHEEREFLETCFAKIPANKRTAFCKRISSDDERNVDAALYELVAHELFRRLHMTPEFGPKLKDSSTGNPLTPDLMVQVGGQDFILDVFLTHNPTRTIKPLTLLGVKEIKGVTYTVDAGDRAKKIWETVLNKYKKYDATGTPLILVVFLGDHWVEMYDAQTALYGAPIGDRWLSEDFPRGLSNFRQGIASADESPPSGGAMLPDESGRPGCPRLSAVVACDWFYTLNRSHPGRRLYVQVLHHWSPDLPMTVGQYGEFAEITWSVDSTGCYRWQARGSLQTVAAFEGSDELKFQHYHASDPW